MGIADEFREVRDGVRVGSWSRDDEEVPGFVELAEGLVVRAFDEREVERESFVSGGIDSSF